MNRRASNPATFRADPTAPKVAPLKPRQALALLAGLAVLIAAVAVAAVVVKPNKARDFDLFRGSMFLGDDRAPVALDLTNGKPTVRLLDANAQVSAGNQSDLDVVPLSGATMLVNRATGEFNVVDTAGFTVKTTGGGVPLPAVDGLSGTQTVPSGSSAYVVQSGKASTGVYLVSQSTVEAARAPKAKVRPRASATVEASTSNAAGTAASANGNLWLLTGPDTERRLIQLSIPKNSDVGADLDETPRGDAAKVAAIGVTAPVGDQSTAVTSDRGGPSGQAVALATPDSVTVFSAGAGGDDTSRKVAVTGLDGVNEILAASDSTGQFDFLYRTGGGWTLVTVPTNSNAVVQHNLTGFGATADLAPPAVSDGLLYTVDRASGSLWTVDVATGPTQGSVRSLEGMAQYPLVKGADGKALETSDFRDVQVLSRASRVVLNSPNHTEAVMVFTDRTAPPRTVDKSTAVDLNAAGGAAAVVDTRKQEEAAAKDPKPAQSQPQPTPAVAPAAPQIDSKVVCATTTQTPHIPTFTAVTPASRSVNLAWNYPLLDTQDCAPSTYTVAVKLLDGKASTPPGPVTVQGQTGVNLTGLYPNSRYEVVVTAFINGKGTPSPPYQFTTGREGPAAPTGVHSTVDNAGNWTITWNACGSAANGCVPPSYWSVTPAFCDGQGLSAPISPVIVTGDATLTTFTATFSGGSPTLGRGLNFQVQGVGDQGDLGAVGADKTCVFSWAPPDPAAFGLAASAQPQIGASTDATFTMTIDGDPVTAGGGVGAQYTYQLLNSAGAVLATQGPTSSLAGVFKAAIDVGKQYQILAMVAPPKHAAAAVKVGPVPVTIAQSSWPGLTATASFAASGLLDGTVTVAVGGLSSAAAGGEQFSLVSGSLVCGSSARSVGSFGPFDPGAAPITFTLGLFGRLDYSGDCQIVGLALRESSGVIFGGTASAGFSSNHFTIDDPGYGGGTADYAATFNGNRVSIVHQGNDPTYSRYANFSFHVTRSGVDCGTFSGGDSAPSFDIGAIPDSNQCKDQTSQPRGDWQVAINYTFRNQPKSEQAPIGGAAPSYTPVTPTPVPTPTPTSGPTPTPRPTATPRVTPTPTPKPTP